MNVVVIGLGSMGKRRIRLLKQINSDIEVIGVDSRDDRRAEVEELFDIRTVSSIDKAVEIGCECAFVCTSPLSHSSIIEECLKQGLHVFTEINLVSDKYDSNIKLAKDNDLVLFLSSTFLYREEIKRIQTEINGAKSLLSYTYHVGQYLPDWHPWESYTDYFIGDSRTSGCREIMAIDLPWLYKSFGKISDINVIKAKKTSLKTTYDDSYLMIIQHENGTQGSVVIDVVSRKAVRNLEVFGEDLYLTWDGTAEGLYKYDYCTKANNNIRLYDSVDRQDGYASFVVENAYRSEIETFLRLISGDKLDVYNFEEDKYVLGIIDKIEGKIS